MDLMRELEQVKKDVILAKQQVSQLRVEKDAKEREIKRLRYFISACALNVMLCEHLGSYMMKK